MSKRWVLAFLASAAGFAGTALAAEAEIVSETSLRRTPEAAGLSGLLTPGTPVTVLEERGEWVRVRIEGWVRASAVESGAARAEADAPAQPVAPAADAAGVERHRLEPSSPPPATSGVPRAAPPTDSSRMTPSPVPAQPPQHATPVPAAPGLETSLMVPVEGRIQVKVGRFRKLEGEGAVVVLLPAGFDMAGSDPAIDDRIEEIDAEAGRLKTDADRALQKTSNFTEASREHDRLMQQREGLLRQRQDLLAVRHGRHEVAARNAAIATTTADSKGWFSLSAPRGDYKVYARLTTRKEDLEWIEPIRVEDVPVKLQLDEENVRGTEP